MLLLWQYLKCTTYFPLSCRLSGQRVTKLAVQLTSAIQLKNFQDYSKQHILFVTMGQRKLIVAFSLFGVFCSLNIPTDLVSDVNNDGCSCNKFQNKLHPHVTCPRETSLGHWEQNLLDIAGTAENPIIKKAGEQIIAVTTHHNADGGRKCVMTSVSAGKLGKMLTFCFRKITFFSGPSQISKTLQFKK